MPQYQHASTGVAEPDSTVEAKYMGPSITRILQQNEKLASLYNLNTTTPFFVQRLSEKVYFYGGGFYTCCFYVGTDGVLLFDAPERQGPGLNEAIAQVTALPVAAIVYSHNHADHIIAAQDILNTSRAAGFGPIRIIASSNTAEKMQLLKCSLPPPTETVEWPNGSFSFESVKIHFHGFVRAAHCDDAGIWFMPSEKVVYLPDLMNGDQPPFWRFATAENFTYYRGNISQLGALDWIHHVGGHGNVGSKQDIEFYNQYLDDLEAAVTKAKEVAVFGMGVDFKTVNNHADLMTTWMDQIGAATTGIMRPKYGKFYGFEISVPANSIMVLLEGISYR